MTHSFWKKIKHKAILALKNPGKPCSAVILAAGKSTRMGEDIVSKQMLSIAGKPVVVHSLLAFEKSHEISEIIVVAKKKEMDIYKAFKKQYHISKLKIITCGGASRAESAIAGFRKISKESGFVAIHDAARCLISPEEIDRVVAAARKSGAAIAAIPATDTVKRADEKGFIAETPDRSTLWLAQTPQVFLRSLYEVSLAMSRNVDEKITDDASMAEKAGFHVKLVPCSSTNIKITTPSDIAIASGILAERNGGSFEN